MAKQDVEHSLAELQGRVVRVCRMVDLEALIEEQVFDHTAYIRFAIHDEPSQGSGRQGR